MAGWGDFMGGKGAWHSQSVNTSTTVNAGSGQLQEAQTTPAGTSVAWFTRSSPDNATWSAWTAVNGDGTLASPQNTYVQVRALLTGVPGTTPTVPTVTSATLSFDGTPDMQALNGVVWTDGGYFTFATLNDLCTICNGLDSPAKYDGTTLSALGGTPPPASYQAVHQNRVFMARSKANSSRLWFSDPLNSESWPVLNFIDISPDDGDEVTGLVPFGDVLVVTKQHSTWVLQGDSIDNFYIQKVHANIGCVAPASLVALQTFVAMVAIDGIYFTDLNNPILATERIKPDFDATNPYKRDIAAAGWFPREHMYFCAVPSTAGSWENDAVFAYDLLRQAWDLRKWSASGFTTFREEGNDEFFFADSGQGQVWGVESDTENGAVVPFVWETRSFDFDAPERLKRLHRLEVVVRSAVACTLSVQIRTDLGGLGAARTLAVPGDGQTHTLIIVYTPDAADEVQGHQIGAYLTNETAGARPEIHSITLEYLTKVVRAS